MKLPPEFLNSLKNIKGFDEKALVEVHSNSEKITSVRLNPFKPQATEFTVNESVLWCNDAFYLKERPAFIFDPSFHAGNYYVQEAGSTFLSYILKECIDLDKNLTVLDLCAAPGGKSTLINSLINESSVLISNEVIKPRADVLVQNMIKWGTCNVAVTNSDPSVFNNLENAFDVIVADVPCSGSGLFRKQPEAINEWSLDNVALCSKRQKRILSDVISSLKEGGVLIYSTCSYSEEENEKIVEWLVSNHKFELITINIEKNWGVVDTDLGYRFYPYLCKSEGFFCAALVKKESSSGSNTMRNKKNNLETPNSKELALIENYVTKPNNSSIVKFKSEFKLAGDSLINFYKKYNNDLYFKKLGTAIGEIKHNHFLPDYELAQSIYVNQKVNKIHLTRDEAISFLQKNNLSVIGEKGINLMCYREYGLGWAKLLDNRLNNYLPKNFRILKSEED